MQGLHLSLTTVRVGTSHKAEIMGTIWVNIPQLCQHNFLQAQICLLLQVISHQNLHALTAIAPRFGCKSPVRWFLIFLQEDSLKASNHTLQWIHRLVRIVA